MSKRSEDVRAWVADKKTADGVPTTDLDKVQRRFGDKIAIQRTRGGGIVIFPNTEDVRTQFDAFMQHTAFLKQTIILERM